MDSSPFKPAWKKIQPGCGSQEGTKAPSHRRSGTAWSGVKCTRSGGTGRSPPTLWGSVSRGPALLGRSSLGGRQTGREPSPACGRRCPPEGRVLRQACQGLCVGPSQWVCHPPPPLVNKAACESFMGSRLKIDETRPLGPIPRSLPCWAVLGPQAPQGGGEGGTTGWGSTGVLTRGPGPGEPGMCGLCLGASREPPPACGVRAAVSQAWGLRWEGEPRPPPRGTLGWGTMSEELSGAVTGESRRCH